MMETTRRPWPNSLATGRVVLLLVCVALISPASSASAEELSLAPGLTLVTGEGWSSAKPRAGETALLRLRGADGRAVGRALITVNVLRTAEEAVTQLGWNVHPGASPPSIFNIAGWPAVTYTRQVEPEAPEGVASLRTPEPFTRIVTLVAVDKTLVRISVTLAPRPRPEALTRAYELSKGLRIAKRAPGARTRRHLRSLRTELRSNTPQVFSLPLTARRRDLTRLGPRNVTLAPSAPAEVGEGRELEIAVSPDGMDIVISSNGDRTFTSNDGGLTFTRAATPIPPTPPGGTGFNARGDYSVARAPSGRFYLSYLGEERFPQERRRQTVSVAVSEPDERGRGFEFLSHAVRCADDDVFTTDQPHIAVDPRPDRPDQVYVAWRANQPLDDTVTCSDAMSGYDIMLTCSADGGAAWARTIRIDEENMYPRVTVGPDGMVYVVWETARDNASIWLTKLSSCEDGLQRQFDVRVTRFVGVSHVPGLDRNDNGNILASPTVAVDPSNPLRVYVAYADQTADGAEDIVVRGSLDGGRTWPLRTTANAPDIPARRFMPWLCAAPEQLFVSWYDRRDASAEANDLTRYFVGMVRPIDNDRDDVPEELRSIEAGVSAVPDPQCRIWPRAPRHTDDSELCTAQPRLAGRCCVLDASGDCTNPSSRRCDFSDTPGVGTPPCLAGETCATGSGQPKYGDYTGNACLAGRAYLTWATATNPRDGDCFDQTRVFFATAYAAFVNLCASKPCGAADPGNLGELLLRCPGDDCRIVTPVPELCHRVLNCPGCGPDGNCPREFTFELDGLDPGWNVRIVDEKGRAAHGAVRRTGDSLAVALRPGKAEMINGRVGRYFLVLDGNARGKRRLPVRLRVKASAP